MTLTTGGWASGAISTRSSPCPSGRTQGFVPGNDANLFPICTNQPDAGRHDLFVGQRPVSSLRRRTSLNRRSPYSDYLRRILTLFKTRHDDRNGRPTAFESRSAFQTSAILTAELDGARHSTATRCAPASQLSHCHGRANSLSKPEPRWAISSAKGTNQSVRQSEDPLGDDVELHLRGAPFNGVGLGAEPAPGCIQFGSRERDSAPPPRYRDSGYPSCRA